MTNLLLLAILGVGTALLYGVWKTYRKVARIYQSTALTERDTKFLFNQVQAYHELMGLIRPEHPLPAMRGWAASPDFLLHVASHAIATRPRLIVECSSGVSTIVLARCCQLNGTGRVVSLEHGPEYAQLTREHLAEHGLEGWATVLDAPLGPHERAGGQPWYSTRGLDAERGEIDMLVIDGPPGDGARHARYPALPVLASRLSASCAVFLDDARRTEEREIVARWTSEFPEFTSRELTAEKGCVRLLRQVIAREAPLAARRPA